MQEVKKPHNSYLRSDPAWNMNSGKIERNPQIFLALGGWERQQTLLTTLQTYCFLLTDIHELVACSVEGDSSLENAKEMFDMEFLRFWEPQIDIATVKPQLISRKCFSENDSELITLLW